MSRRQIMPEERAPCGAAGGLAFHHWPYSFVAPAPDLSDVLVARVKPWALVIWEPLRTKAPAPPKAQPYCCYIRTVKFYHQPYVKRAWHRLYHIRGGLAAEKPGGFEEWDSIEARLCSDAIVTFEGERFEIAGGSVRWAPAPDRMKRRWWMVHFARRQSPEHRRAA